MKADTVLVDFVGATAHFTKQLKAALNNEAITKTTLITLRPGVGNTEPLALVLWNRFVRLALIPINYIILFMRVIVCGPNKIFIFNIPLVPSVEIFFLRLIRKKGGVSVGILHNLIPSHGEKKRFRNYRYSEFYSYCDIVVFHDSSIGAISNKIFPKSFPLFIDLPSYSVPNSCASLRQNSKRSAFLKLGFMGTLRPYKNLEIVASEFKKLSDRELSSVSLKITGKAFYDIDNLVNGFENLGLGEFFYNKGPLGDDDFFREMAECDFLLLPHAHSSGSALLSVAASLGVPVIASDLPVFADFVHRYGNGIIFDHLIAGDLYRVVSALVEDKVERQDLKTRALRAVKSIPSWTNYVNDIFVCCDELVKRRAR
jgi:glycosyltransferase involved in cell wall biosynthesis